MKKKYASLLGNIPVNTIYMQNIFGFIFFAVQANKYFIFIFIGMHGYVLYLFFAFLHYVVMMNEKSAYWSIHFQLNRPVDFIFFA